MHLLCSYFSSLRAIHKRRHQSGQGEGGLPKDYITYKAYLVKVMSKGNGGQKYFKYEQSLKYLRFKFAQYVFALNCLAVRL